MSKFAYDSDTLAHRLKVLRAEARMDQQALADASGGSKDSIARYETGRNVPQLDTAFALAMALGCRIDDLVSLPAPAERGAVA